MKTRAVTRALGVAAATLVALAPMASAHVTVNPGEVEKGSFAAPTFRVPNERDDAGTTSLEVNLPEDQAFTSVRREFQEFGLAVAAFALFRSRRSSGGTGPSPDTDTKEPVGAASD